MNEAILKAYQLVTEAYWQKCRSCIKRDDQNHVEFSREKELLFEKWLTFSEVPTHFNKLRQNNSY